MILVKVVLVSLITCFIGMVASLWIGHHLPNPERGLDLHLGECALPCWSGIVPGKTTVEQAQASLAEIFPPDTYDIQANRLLVATDQEARTIAITRRDDPNSTLLQLEIVALDHIVYALVVTPQRSSDPTVGDLVSIYGLPSCIGVTDTQRHDVILFYTDLAGNRTLEIAVSPHWMASVPVLAFSEVDDPAICQGFLRWRGLSSYDRYFRRQ